MTMPFASLPVRLQNTVCFWAMLVCLISMADAMLFRRQRRRALCALSTVHFFAGFMCVYLCLALREARLTHGFTAEAALTHIPAWCVAVPLGVMTLAGALLYRNVRRWRRDHITAASIKESIDNLPAGVCYYLDEGRCMLVNHRMNEIALQMTGRQLQNGAALRELAEKEPVHLLPDDTAVTFRHRLLELDGAPLHELIADDITELHRRAEQLRRDNERARRLSESVRAYGETIADTVRRNEILQAKISIHDEMNHLILATRRAVDGPADPVERAETLRLWQRQALLLCREADEREHSNVVSDLDVLAKAIGVRLNWQGSPETDDRAALTLFLLSAREAMANAARHAGAQQVTIAVTETVETLTAVFTNDGAAPSRPVSETGGLRNLRSRLESAGGDMTVCSAPRFSLTVSIPKGGRDHAL